MLSCHSLLLCSFTFFLKISNIFCNWIYTIEKNKNYKKLTIMMRSLSYLFVLTALTYSTNSNAAMWAAGDLTYANGETEVSAFVNAPGDTQLQAVLCSKNSQNNYRFTLLLPKKLDSDSVIKVNVKTD